MSADKLNVHGLPGLIHRAYDPIVISFHIKYDPVAAYKRGMAESVFDILWRSPILTLHKSDTTHLNMAVTFHYLIFPSIAEAGFSQ